MDRAFARLFLVAVYMLVLLSIATAGPAAVQKKGPESSVVMTQEGLSSLSKLIRSTDLTNDLSAGRRKLIEKRIAKMPRLSKEQLDRLFSITVGTPADRSRSYFLAAVLYVTSLIPRGEPLPLSTGPLRAVISNFYEKNISHITWPWRRSASRKLRIDGIRPRIGLVNISLSGWWQSFKSLGLLD